MSEYIESLLTQTEALRNPISEAEPGGADVSFDPDFEKVKGEVDKLSSMSGGTPDWRVVKDVSAKLLSTRAKDIRLATWMANAELTLGGWSAFAKSLVVIKSIFADYWDTSFPPPKRERARANQMQWLYEIIGGPLGSLQVTMQNGDAVRAVDTLLGEIDEMLSSKMSGSYQGLGPLRSTMRNRVRDIPEPPPPPPPPPPEPEPSNEPEPAATSGSSSDSGGGYSGAEIAISASAQDAEMTLKSAADGLCKLAHELRKLDPTSPTAFRIVRLSGWLPVSNFPAVQDGRLVGAQPPPPEIAGRVRAAVEEKSWTVVVDEIEAELAYTPLWLDGHRLVAVALEALGGIYATAREVVGVEAAHLLRRHPQILSYRFDDDTPLADDQTRAWFEGEARRTEYAGSGMERALSSEDAAIERRMVDARTAVAEGRIEEGLGLAAQIARRGEPRARFRARLAMAELSMTAGSHDLARPILEGLAREMDAHQLESWEPALCAQVLEALVRCLRTELGAAGIEDAPAREAAAFARLCVLDPSGAMRAVKPI